MSEAACSLFESLSPDVPVAFWNGEYIYPDKFQQHVLAVAESLPAGKYAVNLCEDRYHFLVGFAACLLRSQTSLLPPSRAAKEVERILCDYADAYCIVDSGADRTYPGQFAVDLTSISRSATHAYAMDHDAVAAIVFTSGSTGVPQPHQKRWKDLVASSEKLKQRLNLESGGFDTIIATVPPQHMYGFELSIIYPLVNGACMHAGRPFFPQDIKDELEVVESPRLLVTTPVHLRACNAADMVWPEIKAVISAAAELPEHVASRAEAKMETRVLEVYGCTEAGAIAVRRTISGRRWDLLDGYSVTLRHGATLLRIPGIEQAIEVPDILDIIDDEGFSLAGRNNDVVKIGGKRASLSGLVTILKGISGVEDGLIMIPDRKTTRRPRLVAIVVAPGVSERKILSELANYVDQVFLPREIIKVTHLPYSDSGKLPMESVYEIFERGVDSPQERITA